MILQEKVNLSLLFLLPLIGTENETWMKYIGEGVQMRQENGAFVNGYSLDINKPWLDEHIFLMFEAGKERKINEKEVKKKESYISTYSYRIENKFYDIYSFKIEKEFIKDKDLILTRRYKDISAKAKEAIISFWKAMPNSTVFKELYGIQRRRVFTQIDDEYIDECDYIGSISDEL